MLIDLIDQHRMALTERAALGVLARQPDTATFKQQAAEAERLAGGPVDALAGVDGLGLGLELADDLWVEVEVVRHVRQGGADLLQRLGGDRSGFLGEFKFLLIHRVKAGPMTLQPIGLVRLVGFGRGVGVFQRLGELVPYCLSGLGGDGAIPRQSLGVQCTGRLCSVDRFVHQRLGKCRLIGLVVAMAAVADDVEHDVAAELHAVFGGHARAKDHRFGSSPLTCRIGAWIDFATSVQ